MKTFSHGLALAAVAICSFGLAGCEAYNKAAYGILDNMEATSGSVKVVNTMSVPVCQISMVHAGEPERSGNDLQGKLLAPGAEGSVGLPYVGKASEHKPQPETWTMKVYGCRDRTAYEKEAGSLLATIENVKSAGGEPVAIR